MTFRVFNSSCAGLQHAQRQRISQRHIPEAEDIKGKLIAPQGVTGEVLYLSEVAKVLLYDLPRLGRILCSVPNAMHVGVLCQKASCLNTSGHLVRPHRAAWLDILTMCLSLFNLPTRKPDHQDLISQLQRMMHQQRNVHMQCSKDAKCPSNWARLQPRSSPLSSASTSQQPYVAHVAK